MIEPRDAAIAVVVVTHESAATIDECLMRLRAAAGVTAIRVVDNSSGDGTMDIIQRHAAGDPRVRFVANPDNPGFAVACNQGVAELASGADGARWLAFVNPDCLVEPDTLARLRSHAEPIGDVVLGADLVDEDGRRDPAARRHDPDFGMMLGRLLRAPLTATRLDIAPDDGQSLQRVEAVSGALMLLPRALFDRIGGFDTGYRLHAEDLDLCRRAREAGATIAVANHVRVVHVRGVSSRARPLFVEWHKHHGLWRYFSRFEAPRRGPFMRGAVFAAIWLKFPIAAMRAWLRSWRPE
jgi:GT2 family glycosyltransferase